VPVLGKLNRKLDYARVTEFDAAAPEAQPT
jgi:hypothetical protein